MAGSEQAVPSGQPRGYGDVGDAVQLQDLVPELKARPERELLDALEVDRRS